MKDFAFRFIAIELIIIQKVLTLKGNLRDSSRKRKFSRSHDRKFEGATLHAEREKGRKELENHSCVRREGLSR